MKTAVVILNWNGRDFLERFLPSLVGSLKGFDAGVVVADNASEDDSLSWIKDNFPEEVETIKFLKNHGFTGGYDKAFKKVKEAHPELEYFLLINSDIEVTEDWFYPLEEWMDLHEECAACSPKLHSFSERDRFEYAGAAGGYLDALAIPFCRGRVLGRTEKDKGQYDLPEDVLWATGACLMFRASVWESLGGLDKRFFAHMEEIDLCWRARLDGWRVCVVPRSLVYHVGGGSLPQDSPWKLELNYRNSLLMIDNNMAKAEALSLVYELMAVNADEFAVSYDPVANCRASFEEMDRRMQALIIEEAARGGMRHARNVIRGRMFFDFCTRMVYRLRGHKDYSDAVKKAHKDYREMTRKTSKEEICKWLAGEIAGGSKAARTALRFNMDARSGAKVVKKGIHDGYITIENALNKEGIFDYLRQIDI